MTKTIPLLNLWSGYSLLRSLWDPSTGLARLKRLGYQQVGLADYETMAGLELFDRTARAAGLDPWLGVTRRVVVPTGSVELVRLYACSPQGWGLLSASTQTPGPWTLADLVSSELAVVVAGPHAEWWLIPSNQALLSGFGHRVVELGAGDAWPASAVRQGWRWLPAWGVRYADPADRRAYEVLTAIGGHEPEGQVGPEIAQSEWLARARHDDASLFYASPPPRVLPEPVPRLPGDGTPDDLLARLAGRVGVGLANRFGRVEDSVKRRAADELAIIGQLGFAGYFLMVGDLVTEAQRRGIRVGPGRGSSAGSLVAYALGITAVDPMRYGLLFERFLNPARRNMPDIDLDFEDERRGELLDYLRARWGVDRVAQIGTFGTFGARAAVRDAGRALRQPLERVNAILEMLHLSVSDRLADRRQELAAAILQRGGPAEWTEIALALEGCPRHRSTHAAGVVIAPEPLARWLPCEPDHEGRLLTQMEMGAVERLGFLKLDLLGLRTLTTIRRIEESAGVLPLDPNRLDPRDRRALGLLGRGDTDGVFQLDGHGVKDLLRQMQPNGLEEVMAVVALYRPGPMDAIGQFLARRQGRQAVPNDPVARICADTYGVLLYQEQLMQVVRQLAGYTLAEADLFRRAVSKKDHQMMAQEAERLKSRLLAAGFGATEAERIWQAIGAFADYGFNKSHAASYGLLSYYMAYLKAHWPLAFWCGELSSLPSSDRLSEEMAAAIGQGFRVLLPHVNRSAVGFAAEADALRAGLELVKGLGAGAANWIVEARASGPFSDVADFERRVGHRLPARALQALEAAGALAGLPGQSQRQQLSWFEDSRSPNEPAVIRFADSFGFEWPVADGPVIVRLDSRTDGAKWVKRLPAVAAAHPGDLGLLLAVGASSRGRMVPGVGVDGGWRLIDAIKQMDGVTGAGRRVIRRATARLRADDGPKGRTP
ncbi:MAG: DNA polymerase III subunit alpha [Thermaerobacter sp.]|nr:DNA polymerase III subunit alpha [Thermaerobacter sp.]